MIRERGPMELADQLRPWTQDQIACLNCGHQWVTVRPIGLDYRKLECPFCHGQHSELAHEAPMFVRRRQ